MKKIVLYQDYDNYWARNEYNHLKFSENFGFGCIVDERKYKYWTFHLFSEFIVCYI